MTCICILSRGLPGLEMLAMELKMAGVYVSRQLSFHGVYFKIHEAKTTQGFLCAYRRSIELVLNKIFYN